MHAVELIAAGIALDDPDRPSPPERLVPDVTCCISGKLGPGIERKKLLGKSFCDQAALVAPGSRYVGVAAWTALRYKWERMSCWLAGDGALRLFRGSEGRIALRAVILSGDYPAGPWAGYVTTSYKKHGSLRTPVNSGGRAVWQYDEIRADMTDRERVALWWECLHKERTNGVTRKMLETLQAAPIAIKTVGVGRWTKLVEWATPIHRTGAYKLLCYLLPSKEELDAS